MFVFLFALHSSSLTFDQRSLFGHEGRDEVLIEYVDGFEKFGTVPKPNITHIKEAKFTDAVIEDNDYPWPGHGFRGTCTWARLQQETNAIFNKYYSVNVKQEELYYHPAALKQFQTTDEAEVNNAERISCRITLCPLYRKHGAPIFMPPGEVVTITVPDDAVGQVTVFYNPNMQDIGSDKKGNCLYNNRLNRMQMKSLKLSQKVNHIGTPYGGSIIFEHWNNNPIEINVSGVIMAPFMKYGQFSDDDWETIKKYPGPVAIFDTGNTFTVIPSRYIRGSTRINDVMKWWRSAYQISQTSAQDNYDGNPRDGRILNPPEFNFDSWIQYGWAYAMVGADYCMFPYDASGGYYDWDSINVNNWGNVHEMNHHHQGSWANGGMDEMSNNALNLQIWARTTEASAVRNLQGSNMYSWVRYTHPYTMINFRTNDGGLPLYADMTNFFGADKFREFVRSDQYNTLYNRNDPKLGRRGAQVLRASKIMGRDLRFNYNFHGFNDSTMKNYRDDSPTFQMLDALKLPLFHPVACIYGVGYLTDNNYRFESQRPFKIPPTTYRLNFVSTKIQRADTAHFGDHYFSGITAVSGDFKEIDKEKGLYDLNPNADPSKIDECIAHYLDKTTGLTTNIICKFQQTPFKATFVKYTNLGVKKDLFDAYNHTSLLKPAQNYTIDHMQCSLIKNDNSGWLVVVDADLHVDETGDYEFTILKADDEAALYLSEAGKRLALQPDEDHDDMLIHLNKYYNSYKGVPSSKSRHLETGKIYHICLVVYNKFKGGNGEGYVGMRKVGGSFSNLNQRLITKSGVSYETIWRNQFKPGFFDMPYIDTFSGADMIPSKSGKWNVYKHPAGTSIANSNSGQGYNSKLSITDVLHDEDPTTEWRANWWEGTGFAPFPHVYELDMGADTKFHCIKIGGTGNRGWFDMASTIEVRVADGNFKLVPVNGSIIYDPDNVSLNNDESVVYLGKYVTTNPFIEFDELKHGRYVRVTFYNNSKVWKDQHAGRTSVSGITLGERIPPCKVLPTTLKTLKYNGKWTNTSDGYYYNGRAIAGETGSTISYNVSLNAGIFGILGDLWSEMGTASVFVNGENVANISNEMVTKQDKERMKTAHHSYRQVLYFMKHDNKADKVTNVQLKVTSGTIIINGILTDCASKECIFNSTQDKHVQSDTGNPHEHDGDNQQIPDKVTQALSNSGQKAIAAVSVIAVVVVAVAVFILGSKKGWWCRPPENSQLNENLDV